MKYLTKFLVVLLVGIALLASTEAFAKGGKGQGKSQSKVKVKNKSKTTVQTSSTSGSRPPGWDRGKKTGWRGGKYPPGWSKWKEKEQIKWTADRDSAHIEIRRIMNTYNIASRTQDQIRNGFDDAILGGIGVVSGVTRLVSGLKDPNQRKLFMLNSTQNVLEFLK